MKVKPVFLAVSIALALGPGTSQAQGKGLWANAVAPMCIYQNPKYQGSRFGELMARSPNFMGWDALEKLPVAQCLRLRKWVPEKLCARLVDLVPAKDGSGPELESLRKKYEKEILGLEPVFNYLEESSKTPAKTVECPRPPQARR